MSKAKARSKVYRKELALALRSQTKKTRQRREESEECRKIKELTEVVCEQ